jgi:hypothetical protein
MGGDFMNPITDAIADIISERESQPSFKDKYNDCGMWVSYIANYASRWAMPYTFNTKKYNFRTCMVKTAALCLAAIEWYDNLEGVSDDELAVEAVSGGLDK